MNNKPDYFTNKRTRVILPGIFVFKYTYMGTTTQRMILTGRWSVGWSEQIVYALKDFGIDAIGDHPELRDPFALLLYRIENPKSIYVSTLTDTVYHPEVTKLLRDLSEALLPSGPWTHIHLDVDEHEFFGHCIQNHKFCNTFQDLMDIAQAPLYIPASHKVTYKVPPYCADMPETLSMFILTLKELFLPHFYQEHHEF